MSEGFKNFVPKAEAPELELTLEEEELIQRVMDKAPTPAPAAPEIAVPKVDEPLHVARTDAEVVAFAQTGSNPHQFASLDVKPTAADADADEIERLDAVA